MPSRWTLRALTVGLLAFSACAASTATEQASSSTTGSVAGSGSGGSGGSGGDGGSGGNTACTSAEECSAFTDACNAGVCLNGACTKLPANSNAACDDGLTCTLTEVCKQGVCTAVTQKDCPATDACHVGTCDPQTDTCIQVPGNDGEGCIDDDPCTLTGFCNGGVCSPGQAVNCSFLDTTCGYGACVPQVGCQLIPQDDGAACEDNLFCTDNGECLGGACVGQPKLCTPPNNVCLISSCDEDENTCSAIPGNSGAACDDGNFCTDGETCSAGMCVDGVPANEGATCNDVNECTGGTSCVNGACANPVSEIMACINDDACCPANCPNDNDCIIPVALVYADNADFALSVQNTLVATGEFSTVDLINAEFSTPTAAQLAPYKAVLVYSNAYHSYYFSNPLALGDTLADYFDADGRVVLAAFGNCNGSALGGRFVSDGYQLVGLGDADFFLPVDSLGAINEPGSPLVAGVTTLSAPYAMRCFSSPMNGGWTVASWDSGLPLIVRGTIQGRNRVDLNFYPTSSSTFSEYWTGDGANILKNALLFQ